MFSYASQPDQPSRPVGLTRRGGPVLLRDVLGDVLADRHVAWPAPANPVEDPPPELPRAA